MNKEKSTAFMLKVVSDVAAAVSASLVHVGDRVGLFKAMAGAGPLSAAALAARTGVRERYLEEWLAAMYCAGYVEHDAEAGTWTLPDEHALFFARSDTETYLGGLFKGLPGLMGVAPQLAEAFETGQGISFQAFGDGTPLALEHMNRAVYEARLVKVWLPTLPAVVQALQGGGRAVDVGCGTGVIPVLLAQAFPQAQVSGLDIDARSIELARANAQAAGVDGRVQWLQQGAAQLPRVDGGYDFISCFDCIHDMGDPQGVLRHLRGCLAEGGTLLLVEPRVAERLADDVANPFARMLHGISCLHCVPQSIAQGGPGLGACWGAGRARVMAHEAGFGRFEALPIRSPAQAFYALGA
ncbi:MAG: methyltransferase domain-containing protein [Rubrivivax sp.]